MRASQFFLTTFKEAPKEAELTSHKLMLRAGLIHKLGSGLYTWMPLGLRVLRRVENIVREEMTKAGAIELSMPAVQPAELWQETGRWEKFGPQMLRIKDRHERDFCFGPTHEEVITDIARRLAKSYRQLPVCFYQIQTKFRDEIRPRFGVMRAREFLMKDAYSFDINQAGLQKSYQAMYDAYVRIFDRLGLKFRAVAADTGAIGGSASHEFQVLAEAGEDVIAYCPDSNYAANIELATALAPQSPRPAPQQNLQKVATPNRKTCAEVAEFLQIPLTQMVKSMVLWAQDRIHVVLLRADHELNEVKAAKLTELQGFRLATEAEIEVALGCKPGYIGPVLGSGKTAITVIADRSVMNLADFVCGANQEDYHLTGVNWERDLPEPTIIADLRNVIAGDPSPDGHGTLALCRGIEVGHVFALGTKYSESMQAYFIGEDGQENSFEMGCYGIGVSRIVAAAVEQHHDERGILWPQNMAPFQVALAPIGYEKSTAVHEATDQLYQSLQAAGIDVLLDDRGERPGAMFADLELIGIPHRITIGDRSLQQGIVEYQHRSEGVQLNVPIHEIITFIQSKLAL